MSRIVFRLARETDAAQILDIYSYYIQNTPVTFETCVPSCETFSCRIQDIAAEYPFIVLEKDMRIIGYAYAHRFHERAAYGWNAELSVYTDLSENGKGAGSALYGALISLLKMQNIQNIYGIIGLPNDASMALHHKYGFTQIGQYHATGYKLDAWRDVAIMENAIGDKACPPKDFIPITEIADNVIMQILNSAKETYMKNLG